MSTFSEHWGKYAENRRFSLENRDKENGIGKDLGKLEERIERMQAEIDSANLKLANLSKVTRLQQNYIEVQDQKILKLEKSLLGNDHSKAKLIENKLTVLEDRINSPKFIKSEEKLVDLLEQATCDIEKKRKEVCEVYHNTKINDQMSSITSFLVKTAEEIKKVQDFISPALAEFEGKLIDKVNSLLKSHEVHKPIDWQKTQSQSALSFYQDLEKFKSTTKEIKKKKQKNLKKKPKKPPSN